MKNGIKLPKYKIEDVEDAYAAYVGILGISEDVFWYCDIRFVEKLVRDLRSYQNWLQSEIERRRNHGK